MLGVYLAGHLHNDWRSEIIRKVENKMEHLSLSQVKKIHWLIPMRSIAIISGPPGSDRRYYVPNDIQMINRADVIAYKLEKDHGNIGSAWEVGYAYAKNIPVYTWDLDLTNYKYDILRSTSFVFETEEEFINAIMMSGMTA